MDAFRFQNFRKYRDFPMINLGRVNVFVGPNNSGKSTAMKAMLLSDLKISSYYDTGEDVFLYLPTIDICNYFDIYKECRKGANSLQTDDGNQANKLVFTRVDNLITYNVFFSEEVLRLQISMIVDFGGCRLTIPDVDDENTQFHLSYDDSFIEGLVCELNHYIETVNFEELESSLDEEYSMFFKLAIWGYRVFSVENLRAVLQELCNYEKKSGEVVFNCEDVFGSAPISPGRIRYSTFLSNMNECNHPFLLLFPFALSNILEDNYYYGKDGPCICSNISIARERLYNEEDKEDQIAPVAAAYYRANECAERRKKLKARVSNPMSKLPDFVNSWLKIFGIGESIEVKKVYENYYCVNVIDRDKKSIPLSYMGTGSIKLVVLLLQIALAKFDDTHPEIIYVEEPEQNLHPKLQSLLADLFYECSETQLVVETHSEYLIRRMQVITAENVHNGQKTIDEMNEIFKVYYFPEEGLPYDMKFKSNGHFERKFGKGFFDVAVKDSFALTRLEHMED